MRQYPWDACSRSSYSWYPDCPGWWELCHLQAYCVVLGEPILSFTTLSTFLFELGTELGDGFLLFLNIPFQNLHILSGGNKAYSEKKIILYM